VLRQIPSFTQISHLCNGIETKPIYIPSCYDNIKTRKIFPMPRKNGRKAPAKRRTYFKIKAPEAGNVRLAGTFNAWEPNARKLRMDDRGVWKTSMMLEPGVYEFRFVVDGEWSNDSDSPSVPNPHGGHNCIRVVE
jgi:hypothetical protein